MSKYNCFSLMHMFTPDEYIPFIYVVTSLDLNFKVSISPNPFSINDFINQSYIDFIDQSLYINDYYFTELIFHHYEFRFTYDPDKHMYTSQIVKVYIKNSYSFTERRVINIIKFVVCYGMFYAYLKCILPTSF